MELTPEEKAAVTRAQIKNQINQLESAKKQVGKDAIEARKAQITQMADRLKTQIETDAVKEAFGDDLKMVQDALAAI